LPTAKIVPLVAETAMTFAVSPGDAIGTSVQLVPSQWALSLAETLAP
jgi:hypothetical protein